MKQLPRGAAAEKPQVDSAASSGGVSMVVFSGELDRLYAAFTIATGAAAAGMPVEMFFTFWGTAALKRPHAPGRGKRWTERLLGWMLPGGLHRQPLSRLHWGGLGRSLLRREMRHKKVPDLEELLAIAAETGVVIRICEMSMHLMGIRREELIDYPHLGFCGVAHFLARAGQAETTLFV